jgi:hypothetical protein
MARGLAIGHVMGHVTRRIVLSGAASGVSSILAGCASSTDGISGTVENRTASEVTVSVELIRPDGAVDLGRELDLRPGDSIEFSLTDPAEEYTLRTDVRSGPTRTDRWLTSDCRAVAITLRETAITHEFENC